MAELIEPIIHQALDWGEVGTSQVCVCVGGGGALGGCCVGAWGLWMG